MKKLLAFDLVSLDGYFEGPNRDISWHNVDAEFNDYAIAMLNFVDTLLFGRVTYELMAGFWPTPEAIKNDPIVADKMNTLPKVVFSRTLNKAEWSNTRLVKDNLEDEIRTMKKLPGRAIALLGSGTIMSELAQLGLIDEYWIMVNPLVLGAGTPLFKGIKNRLDLKLLGTQSFRNGNVALRYEPAGKEKYHGNDNNG
jgi:dihydrofolate reductase